MFDNEYSSFRRELLSKDLHHCSIKGEEYRFFVLPASTKYHQKEADVFWHVSSIDYEEGCGKDTEIHPCVNTSFESSCVRLSAPSDLLRILSPRSPCTFRSVSSKYIALLISDLSSGQLTGMRVWIADGPNNGRPTKRFYIRKTYDRIDYVAIFDIKNKKSDVAGISYIPLILVTGFPIELNSYRKKFEREWQSGGLI
jgi:hypothetical protein